MTLKWTRTYRCIKQIHLFENCHTLLSSRPTCSTELQGRLKKEEKKSRITRTCNHTMPSVPLAWHVILNEGKQDGHKFKTQRLRQENQKFQAPGPGWISWRHTKEPKKKRTFSSRSKTKDTNSYQRRKHNAQLWGCGPEIFNCVCLCTPLIPPSGWAHSEFQKSQSYVVRPWIYLTTLSAVIWGSFPFPVEPKALPVLSLS